MNNEMTVRLLGIKENSLKYKEVMNYLTRKLIGEKVFLKYDDLKHDENGHLFCYMYLKNKTFINAHLIKEGLVYIDNDINYRYKDKFIKLEAENG
jgi:endonuclease YncB( thermonuclease family)